jgi:colicin import membrane protein
MNALALPAIDALESRKAFGASVGIHLLLLLALLISLNWSRDVAKPVQAELWSSLPGNLPAAVRTPPPAPAPVPPKPAPVPEPKADIALQKKQELAKKEEAARAALKEKEMAEARRKAAEQKLAQEREAAKLEAQRKSELARLGIDPNAKANAQGKDIATKAGVAKGAEMGDKTGIDASYAVMIESRIKARINYPDRAPGNPEAVVLVEQNPNGEITRVKLVRPSGTPAWDDAVQRAIWASSPLPKKKDGAEERALELALRPKENR